MIHEPYAAILQYEIAYGPFTKSEHNLSTKTM